MLILKRITFASMLIFTLLTTALAQGNSSSALGSSLTITAAASGERVRITAPSSVVQMHVEVYAASGEKLFDQEIRGGNVFDWHLQDGQGQRLAPGTYVCVVTAKSTSGKLAQRIGSVSVEEKSVSVQPAASTQLSTPQAQTIGPVEEDSSWTIAAKDELQTPTVIAHDGTDGQMIRGRGALTFRVGNFFSGVDQEQMRLTEDGRLGIGTSDPRSTLDVAGTIRAQRFLVAKPNPLGSKALASNSAQPTDTAASAQPLASGTGTQDHIAKWTDNAGTLGDSVITESAGNIGLGTPTPTQALEVANGRIIVTGSQTLATPGGILEIGTTLTNNQNQASGIRMRNTFNGNATNQVALDVAPTFAPSASISLARGFISAAFFAPPPGVTIIDGYGGDAVNVYSNTGGAVTNGTAFAINSPFVFGSLKPSNQYGVRINNQGIVGTTNSYGLFVDAQSGATNNYSAIFAGGNVGIGTATPASKLDVVGDINVTGNAVIAGNIAAKYQDVAEWVQARKPITPGTLVILDPRFANAVVPSGHAYDTRVAGVVSARPGVILGEAGTGKVLVATTGRVKVKVDATRHAIKIGDLLVTSDKPGVAMKSLPIMVRGVQIHRPGTIVGKALEPLAKGTREIYVLLSLQ
ncbi:MAG TPA: hypothetical protein VEM96_07455 [Pyrinomonadaceae bacterium]|nr:hypothetical protein [Pyrinomonadaceae bacterium]